MLFFSKIIFSFIVTSKLTCLPSVYEFEISKINLFQNMLTNEILNYAIFLMHSKNLKVVDAGILHRNVNY